MSAAIEDIKLGVTLVADATSEVTLPRTKLASPTTDGMMGVIGMILVSEATIELTPEPGSILVTDPIPAPASLRIELSSDVALLWIEGTRLVKEATVDVASSTIDVAIVVGSASVSESTIEVALRTKEMTEGPSDSIEDVKVDTAPAKESISEESCETCEETALKTADSTDVTGVVSEATIEVTSDANEETGVLTESVTLPARDSMP